MLWVLCRIRKGVVVAGLFLLLQIWKGSTIYGIPRAKKSLSNSPNKNSSPALLLATAAQEASWNGPSNGSRITPWASQLRRTTPMYPAMVPRESVM